MPDTDTITAADDAVEAPEVAIDVWYQNVDTGQTFGFGLPLPKQIPPQIKQGNLVRCTGPEGNPHDSAATVLEADEDGAADPEQDAALYPCETCGDVAVKDADGFYTDYCVKHAPKPSGGGRGRKS